MSQIPALWQILLPNAVPHLIPDGVGRVICDHSGSGELSTPKGGRIDSRTAYELTPLGRRAHPRRQAGAVTTRICEQLLDGPKLHSELILCIGPDPLNRRYARNAIRYMVELQQVRVFLKD